MSILKHLPCIDGRTFVVGDLHGAYNTLTGFMDYIDFNKDQDRIISVGDLVDRGPENEKCLALLLEPWFHACLGNHENMMYEYFSGEEYGDYWAPNGGNWGVKYFKTWTGFENEYERAEADAIVALVRERVSALPLIITVDKNNGTKYHVLHAELPFLIGITDEILADEGAVKEINVMDQGMDGAPIIWGRKIFAPFYQHELSEGLRPKLERMNSYHGDPKSMFSDELSHIYSGHTIVQKPLRIYGQTNLDTCAFGLYRGDPKKWMGLSITEPETNKFWLSNIEGVTETEPFILA